MKPLQQFNEPRTQGRGLSSPTVRPKSSNGRAGTSPALCVDLRHIVHETALNLLSYTPSEANSSLDSIGHTTKDSQNNRRLQNINLIGMPAFYYL